MGIGERGAVEDLGASYSTLFRELTAVFRARGLSTDEANDLAQESLVRTFVHLKRHGQTRDDLRPLAHTIAKRLYVERGRRVRPRFVDLPEAEHLADPAPEPLDHLVAGERRQDVRDALYSLAPRHRRVVTMWMRGLRPAEIARELGIKRNAADALLHRARRQLATKLEPSRATLGLFGIALLKLRLGVRRLADGMSAFDPSGSLVQATAGLATVGVAALLIVASPQGSAPSTQLTRWAPDPTRAVLSEQSADVDERVTATPEKIAEKAAELSTYRMNAVRRMRNPATGQEEDLGLELVYIPDADPSALDSILQPVAALTCQARVLACASQQRQP